MTEETTERTLTGKELLEREGDAAADYLEGLLDIIDLDGDIEMDVDGNRAVVTVVEANGGELGHLVGPEGRVLDALQELARLAATRETGEPVHAGVTSSGSLWWSFDAPTAGSLSLSTEGSGIRTVLAAYTGSTVASLAIEYGYSFSPRLQVVLWDKTVGV